MRFSDCLFSRLDDSYLVPYTLMKTLHDHTCSQT